MEGYLNKKGVLTWKKRWFVLSSNKIAYFSKEGDTNTRGELALEESSKVSSINSRPNSFQVITGNRALVVSADTEEKKLEWVGAIKKFFLI